MKKVVALFLAIVLLIGCIPAAFAASPEAVEAANALYALGLFKGVGKNADGTPNFALDRAPTRHEAVTMLVRLLGKEDEAKAGEWDIPFTDVADWAVPYVGYAYENALTKGVSATKFGGNSTVTASQYITFVLRALGYDSSTDFKWDKAWELSDQLGITNGEYNAETESFTRGDVAIISAAALRICAKGSDETLLSTLVSNGAVTEDAANAFLNAPVSVKSVKLSEEIIYLEIDETKTLTAEIQPEDAADTSLTWSSSDKTVATVKDGKVTGISSGSAIITATASNGVSSSCKFEVVNEPIFDFLINYIKKYGSTSEKEYYYEFTGLYDTKYHFKISCLKDSSADDRIWISCNLDSYYLDQLDVPQDEFISTSLEINKDMSTPYLLTMDKYYYPRDPQYCGVYSYHTMDIEPKAFTSLYAIPFREKKSPSYSSIDVFDYLTNFNVTVSANMLAETILSTELTCLEESILIPNGRSIRELGFECLYNPLESFSLYSNATISVGEHAQIIPLFCPYNCSNKGLIWSSSNNNVATVDKYCGVISAVKAGSCTITATATNGFTAQCKIEVVPEAVKSIKLSKSSLSLIEGESAKITATIEPSTADGQKLTWATSDKKVATVKDGKITAVGVGKCEITVTAPNGVEAKCKVEVKADPLKADYTYLAGSDYRYIKRNYSEATPLYAYVIAYKNCDGEICVITDVYFKIISTYHMVTLRNLSTGEVTRDPDSYFKTKISRAYGSTKLHLYDLYDNYLNAYLKALKNGPNVTAEQLGLGT